MVQRAVAALLVLAAIPAVAAPQVSHRRPAILWVQLTEPMKKIVYSQVDGIEFLDRECKSDNVLPRACLYRHLETCRVIFVGPVKDVDRRDAEDLTRMCNGWFPEPVLLKRKFSDPAYLPNQGAPRADAVWQKQHAGLEP